MRILLVTPCPPVPLSIGGNQRTYFLAKALSAFAEVDIVLSKDVHGLEVGDQRQLKRDFSIVGICNLQPVSFRRWVSRISRRINPRLVDRLAHNVDGSRHRFSPDPNLSGLVKRALETKLYDVVVCRYLRTVGQSNIPSGIPIWADVDDLDSGVFESRLALHGVAWWEKLILRRHLKNIKKGLLTVLPKCNWLWVSNPSDILTLPPNITAWLPNLPFNRPRGPLPPRDAGIGPSFNLMMVGSWAHPPNQHGLSHFITDIWPTVLNVIPNARLRIIGSQMRKSMADSLSQEDGVDVVGFVHEVSAEYQRCDVAIAPIYYGGGTNIKVLDAMAHHRPCVLTPFAFRGYNHIVRDGEHVLVAHRDEDWAGIFSLIHGNGEFGRNLASKAYAKVSEHYTNSAFSSQVSLALDQGTKSFSRKNASL